MSVTSGAAISAHVAQTTADSQIGANSAIAAGSAAHLVPQEIIARLEQQGILTVLITCPQGRPKDAEMAFSTQLGRAQADEIVLEIAMRLIGSKWPELQQLLANYQQP